MARLRISLVPFALAGLDPADLAACLADSLDAEVSIVPGGFDPLEAYDESRGQHRTSLLLDRLAPYPGDVVLGATSLDLFVPILTFVFGEALLGGRTAVVSTHRLEPERYGLPPSPSLLLDRTAKEALHEVGHCLGLVHCVDPSCAMAPSTSAEEVDLKGPDLCGRCRGRAEAPAGRWAAGTPAP